MLGEFIWTVLVFAAGTWVGHKHGGPVQVWNKVWAKVKS